MADWSHPVLSDGYSAILTTHLAGRDLDAITLCNVDPTNIPTHAIKYDRATNRFRERVGGVWVDLILDVTGGGTGSNTAAGARTNLGLGSMATQNANLVAITGGSIAGVTLDAGVITTGTVALLRGGTGASLSLGAVGTFLRSTGAAVAFGTDGGALINLNATQLTTGTIPTGRYGGFGAYIAAGSGTAATDGFVIAQAHNDNTVNDDYLNIFDGTFNWAQYLPRRGTVSNPAIGQSRVVVSLCVPVKKGGAWQAFMSSAGGTGQIDTVRFLPAVS